MTKCVFIGHALADIELAGDLHLSRAGYRLDFIVALEHDGRRVVGAVQFETHVAQRGVASEYHHAALQIADVQASLEQFDLAALTRRTLGSPEHGSHRPIALRMLQLELIQGAGPVEIDSRYAIRECERADDQ